MLLYIKVLNKNNSNKKNIQILNNKISEEINIFKFIIDNDQLIINFDEDYNKLIYTLKWIDDTIDKKFRETATPGVLSILIADDKEKLEKMKFFKGFKTSFTNNEFEIALQKHSQIKKFKKINGNFTFDFEYYSRLEYGKIINLETERGMAKLQVVRVKSHNLLFSLFWKGELKDGIDVRAHYQCETSEIFQSIHCDCREQLKGFIDHIFKQNSGLLIYCHEEGRGLGLFNKIEAYYETETCSTDTKTAMEKVAGKTENRFFEIPADIMFQKGISEINLWTNNPLKITPFYYRNIIVNRKEYWTNIKSFKANKYIEEKIKLMGHYENNN